MRRLDLIIDGTPSQVETTHRLTFASSSQDHLDLGASINGAVGFSFKFTPTVEINASTPSLAIFSRLAFPFSNPISQVEVLFFSGVMGYSYGINTPGDSVTTSGGFGNTWIAGQTYYIHCQNHPVNGMELYVDGVKQTGTVNNPSSQTSPFTTSTEKLFINGRPEYGDRFADYSITDLACWDVAKSQADVDEDLTRVFDGTEAGLRFVYPPVVELGSTINDLTGNYSGTINTLDAGGTTYINENIRDQVDVITEGDPQQVKTFDLYEADPISVVKRSTTVKDLKERDSGTTNSFNLPLTPNNNNIFDFLDLNGNTSQFPYKNNYVRYIEDGIEVIPKGRMNVKGVNNEGYIVDITHGINDFFDLIRGKFLHEAYEPYRVTLNTMEYADTILTNDTNVRDNEGYVVPLMDLGFINPIPDYQQTVAYFLKFGLEKICDHVGYTLGNVDVDLTDYVFTHEKAPSFDIVTNNRFENGLLSSLNNTAFKGGEVKIFSNVLNNKSILKFNQIALHTSTPTSATYDPELEIRVDGVVVYNVTVTPTGTTLVVPFFTSFNSSPNYYDQGSLVEVYLKSPDYNAGDELTVQYFVSASFISDFKVFHENILLDYTQTDFIKNILQAFNLGIDIDFITKTINFYSKNEVFAKTGNTVDLSKYFSELISKDFVSEYGLNNFFKYKYTDGQNSFADGFLTANNLNNDKTIIDSEITASSNDSLINLGGDDVYLTTAKGYDEKTVNSKTNTIGFRINKVLRFESVDVDYLDKLNVTTTVNSDQTTLTFSGLDWNTLIEENYSNLRDNTLNRFARYKVLMRVPRYIIRNFSFEDKIYIDSLGHNFVVEEIRTLQDGLSEWTLIRINN